MKALEFEATLGEDASLKVPESVASQIPKQELVRVILLLADESTERDWSALTETQFLRGYSESDSAYDEV